MSDDEWRRHIIRLRSRQVLANSSDEVERIEWFLELVRDAHLFSRANDPTDPAREVLVKAIKSGNL